MNSTQRDRAIGCLFGQVIGDALGAQVEFRSADSIAKEFHDGVRELTGGGPWKTRPGQVTDDSELALSLARSIVRREGYNENDVAAAYRGWYETRPVDVGGTTANALSGPFNNTDPLGAQMKARALRREDSQSNGSLMRVSPLGIYVAGLEQAKALEHTLQGAMFGVLDSSLTHSNMLCRVACGLFVNAISYAINCTFTLDVTKTAVPMLAKVAAGTFGSEHLATALELALIEEPSEADGANQGFVRIAFQNAFHQLRHAPSFEEAVVRTISLGGDTDTNAAIAGALYGATVGASGIPERWRQAVLSCCTNRGPTFQTADLEDLAVALFETGEKQAPFKG